MINGNIFFKNGTLKMEGEYRNNKRTGLWKRYNEKGILIAEIEFKNGKREGKSIFYNNDGSLIETKLYQQDKVIK